MGVLSGDSKIDFVGRKRAFGTFSGVAVLISVLAIAVIGLNFGIDFAGGYEIQAKFEKSVTDGEIKALLEPLVKNARVQRFGAAEENEFLILVREQGTVTAEQKIAIQADFESLAGGVDQLTNWAIAESGESLTLGFASPISEEQVRSVIIKRGLKLKDVRRGEREDRPEFVVALVSLADEIEGKLREGFQIPPEVPVVKRVEFVGPQVGQELQNQGILAIVYALGFILFYIAVRFDFAFAPGAVLALIHDVLITVGIFAICRFEFNLPIIAAILALVGYSLNDTIVVYDRIRENVVRLRGRSVGDLVNTSINQTLSRTLLTSGTTLLVVAALLVVGGGIIRDFSIALCIGVVVGTYSSVGIAAPSYIYFQERSAKTAEANKRGSAAATV